MSATIGTAPAVATARLGRQQRLYFVEQPFDVLEITPDVLRGVPVFVEVDVETVGYREQPADVLVASLVHQSGNGHEKCGVVSMFPATLISHRFHYLGSSAPTFLGGLPRVALGQFIQAPVAKVPGWQPDKFETPWE